MATHFTVNIQIKRVSTGLAERRPGRAEPATVRTVADLTTINTSDPDLYAALSKAIQHLRLESNHVQPDGVDLKSIPGNDEE